MSLGSAARVAAAALLLLLLCVRGVWADAMVVAGRRVESRVQFVTAANDVFAPLLSALSPLGAKAQLTSDSVRITTSADQEIAIFRARPEATRDGVLRAMPGVPMNKEGALLLPAKAVGSLLGCAVRWDETARVLFIHPWVRKFTLETLADRYRISVTADSPIAYRSGRVEDGTPRLFLDVLNADLPNIPSELKLDGSYLRVARIRQKSLAPEREGDVVRLVVELTEWKPYHIRLGPGRRTLQIDFPLPGSNELGPEATPVVLSGLSFRRVSPKVAMVTVATFGKATCQSGLTEDPPSVWVDFASADNRIADPLPEIKDKLVSAVTLGPAPGKPGTQRLAISLSSAVDYSVSSDRGQVRVMLGKFEMPGLCVVIDAGHGGPDSGAVGRSGMLEKDVNLDIARRVGGMLEAMGVRVRLTRTTDAAVIPWDRNNREQHRQELISRCTVADECGAQLFVSIHANANSRPLRGTETYYRKPDSKTFAEVMQQEVVKATGLPDGGAKYHPEPIIVLYQTTVPAVLVEVAYLSNSADERKLADSDFREEAARGIVNGIKRYAEESGVAAGATGAGEGAASAAPENMGEGQ